MTTYERLKNIIIEQLGVEPEIVTPEASFREDLGADSLDNMELMMAVEEEFDIVIEDEDSERLKTVADAVKLIDRLVTERGEA